MRVLVTGANGFLGSHVAELLAAHGHELKLLLRPTSRLEFLDDLEFERSDGDIRDSDSVLRALENVDAIVHIAGLTSALSELDYQAVNANGTANLVQAARNAGIERFVYASSLAALGPSPDGHPRPPEPAQPVSAYGRSKLQGEYAVRAERHRMNVTVVRLPAIYGMRDRGLLPFFKFAKFGFVPLYGDGTHRITWVHVRDAAGALVLALETSERSGSIFTVSDGEPHTWRELAGMLGTAHGSELRLVPIPGGVFSGAGAAADGLSRLTKRPLPLSAEKALEMSQRFWVCDYELIGEELGWKPRIGAEEGISHTLFWYRQNRWL